jgi:hypothetical protein
MSANLRILFANKAGNARVTADKKSVEKVELGGFSFPEHKGLVKYYFPQHLQTLWCLRGSNLVAIDHPGLVACAEFAAGTVRRIVADRPPIDRFSAR